MLLPADIDEIAEEAANCRAPRQPPGARKRPQAALNASCAHDDELKGAFILAADTVVAVGRRILPKAELIDEAAQCLRLLSGRNHRVYTGVCLVTPREADSASGWSRRACASSVCPSEDIDAYLASGEWRGKAGGYAVQGIAGTLRRQAGRLLFQCRRAAALRDHDAADGRGLSGPLRLAQCGLS